MPALRLTYHSLDEQNIAAVTWLAAKSQLLIIPVRGFHAPPPPPPPLSGAHHPSMGQGYAGRYSDGYKLFTDMRILFIGDIVGRPGRQAVLGSLERLVAEEKCDLVIANCENSAAGFGTTPKIASQLLEAGIDVLTSGNHIWDKKDILPYISEQPRLLRPANYPQAPGFGLYVGLADSAVRYAVMNVQGRVQMPHIDCPFRCADEMLDELDRDVRIRFVDFHAEATSEKVAFGRYLDGRVSAVVGTHTHVPTADERILPGGTAYITDAGMTGPVDSVIGMGVKASVRRFLTGMPGRFQPASGTVRLNSVVIDVDVRTGRAVGVRRRTEQVG